VPVLFFWTGTHNDYHKPSDTADKINYEGEARIVSFVNNIIRDIDPERQRPTYAVAKERLAGPFDGLFGSISGRFRIMPNRMMV